MRDAVIVEAVRTPVGKRNGGCPGCTRSTCPRTCWRRWRARSGIDPGVVDDVVWGCVSQVGEQTFDIARNAVLAAGWPETVTGVTLDRQCGSSQQSVHFAAAGLVAGHYDVVVAGGVESMSRVPMGSSLAGADPFGSAVRRPLRRRAPQPGRRRRDDGRAVGVLAHAAGRVLGGLAREGGRRPRRRPVRRADRAGHHGRRRGERGRGHPPRLDGRDRSRASRPCSSRTA